MPVMNHSFEIFFHWPVLNTRSDFDEWLSMVCGLLLLLYLDSRADVRGRNVVHFSGFRERQELKSNSAREA